MVKEIETTDFIKIDEKVKSDLITIVANLESEKIITKKGNFIYQPIKLDGDDSEKNNFQLAINDIAIHCVELAKGIKGKISITLQLEGKSVEQNNQSNNQPNNQSKLTGKKKHLISMSKPMPD